MTMLTVDDLARDLKVRNEDLLRELVTMGFEVDGPESPLETDDPAALREQLVMVLPQREVVEKRIKPTVIRRRMKKPSPLPERKEMPEQPPAPKVAAEAPYAEEEEVVPDKKAEPPVEEARKQPPKKVRKPEPARIIEMAPKPAAVPEEIEPLSPETPPEEQVVQEAKGAVTPAEMPAAAEPQEAVEPPMEAEQLPAEALAETAGEVPVKKPGAPEAPEALEAEEEKKAALEKAPKKKKKKEKKVQPAQIIGRVELKKEPERPEPPAEPIPETRRVDVTPLAVPPATAAETAAEEERRKKKKKDRRREDGEVVVEEEGVKLKRRKEVILKEALYDDRARPGRLKGKGKKPKQRKTEITQPKAIKRRIKIPESVTVATLAHRMSVKAAEVIQHLLSLGVAATLNETIDYETASLVSSEFGFEIEHLEPTESDLLPAVVSDTEANLKPRPPVVTVMGHVDHGKTSLLDAIRSSHVTDSEAGGITQHIGAYKVKVDDKGEVVFLDTPGHEAFTAMRARGAQVTDFVILVVAADDGVMEQTREAINHSRAANVPIIVAVNKMDKAEADKDRVVREMSELGLIPEAWGGDTLYCYVSAKTQTGIDELLDVILLQSEMMELRANPDKTAIGHVIEARLDKGKGPVATVLVKEGTLRLGDPFVAGTHYGKVRAMLDHEGNSVEQAGPATPVEVQGFSGVPEAGESFLVVEEEKVAKQVSSHRQHKLREQEVATTGFTSLEDILARLQVQEVKELNLVIKADVQGSVEALREALMGIPSQEIKIKVIHSGVGAITESDVMLASASGATIIGFNVRPNPKTTQIAEQEKVDLRLYTVIYEVIDDVRKAMEGMLAPIEKETVMGRAEVIQVFHIAKIGTVAGCHVKSGKLERSNQVRLIRDDRVVYQGKMSSMKRFKEDVKEVVEGYECGLALENFKDVKLGDIIEAFVVEKEAAKLT